MGGGRGAGGRGEGRVEIGFSLTSDQTSILNNVNEKKTDSRRVEIKKLNSHI